MNWLPSASWVKCSASVEQVRGDGSQRFRGLPRAECPNWCRPAKRQATRTLVEAYPECRAGVHTIRLRQQVAGGSTGCREWRIFKVEAGMLRADCRGMIDTTGTSGGRGASRDSSRCLRARFID